MTKKLEIRPSGEVGFVGGYMMAVVYPVAECPQSTAERDFNVNRMIDCWNNYDALQSLNAELLEALEHARLFIRNGVELGYVKMPDDDTPDPAHETLPKIEAALAKARSQS